MIKVAVGHDESETVHRRFEHDFSDIFIRLVWDFVYGMDLAFPPVTTENKRYWVYQRGQYYSDY